MTTEQRAILASYKSAKKAEADARNHEEADEEQFHRALDLSVQRAPTMGRATTCSRRSGSTSSRTWQNAKLSLWHPEGAAACGGGDGEAE
jgi:hypothetical protein